MINGIIWVMLALTLVVMSVDIIDWISDKIEEKFKNKK
jgi:hypothetical protein